MTTPVREKAFFSDEVVKWPRAFLFRRLHSLLGLWLVLYLFEHLLVNSQAAFLLQDDGSVFIRMVNQINSLPYLHAVEILFLGLPFFIHMAWGVRYIFTGKYNSFSTDGSAPALTMYKRNHAYTWQRITSWILLVGIIAHVVHMRFVEYPTIVYDGIKPTYTVRIHDDKALANFAQKLDVRLQTDTNGMVLAAAPNAGTAFLLIVRDTFKSPWMVGLYALLVAAAVFHAFNGLWTFCISWGITLTRRSQKTMRRISNVFMVLVLLFGLMATLGTYIVTRMQEGL